MRGKIVLQQIYALSDDALRLVFAVVGLPRNIAKGQEEHVYYLEHRDLW